MNVKLLADKYIELNVKSVVEINNENYKDFKGKTENYCFILCSNGTMKISINDKIYSLNENDTILVNIQSLYQIFGGNFSAVMVAFNGASADELVMNSIFNGNIFSSDNNLGYYIYKIYHAYHEAEFLSIKCLGLLYELFYEVTKDVSESKIIETSSKEKHIEMAKEFMIQNYHKGITIADVAKKVGVTSNYLANIFSSYQQKAPKNYLTEIRMEQAKKLLATRKYKVKDVGKLVGYENQLHFSGEFKKYTGKSPMDYAKDFQK